MTEHDLRGTTALVTGASSGLGADFARELAARGCGTLILVARRTELLAQVQAEIVASYPDCTAELVTMDLTEPDAPDRLFAWTQEHDLTVDVLVNNAGYGLYGTFLDLDWEREQAMLTLDITVPVHLTKQFLPGMVDRDRGYVLLVASIGAYQPSPLYATYSAAKAFILSWGEALNYELRATKVRVSVVSPGVTATEFLKVAGQRPSRYQRMAMMQSRDVVRTAVDRLLKGQPSVVPGLLNSVMVFGNRFIPRRWSAALAHRLMT
jgi:short-subunit dehydrogenase